uniref:Uncharacterized protein n=1 Tax=Anguilla anguilla TaxID=7936 RepID=A0A0E9SL40_ANGAN
MQLFYFPKLTNDIQKIRKNGNLLHTIKQAFMCFSTP